VVLRQLDLGKLSPDARASLQQQFEAMVVLDIITRNTDRGNDNWLIKHEKATDTTPETITVAAIDNGFVKFCFNSWVTLSFDVLSQAFLFHSSIRTTGECILTIGAICHWCVRGVVVMFRFFILSWRKT
jgi:hypothetical protein